MTALDFIKNRMDEKFEKREQFLSRKDLIIRSKDQSFSTSQLDTIRKQLTTVGYLREWEIGIYRMVKSIPKELNSYKLRKMYNEKLKMGGDSNPTYSSGGIS